MALVTWRLANLVGFVLWLLCVPAAALFGWYHSLPFVALASIYANAISHLAAWRADVPNEAQLPNGEGNDFDLRGHHYSCEPECAWRSPGETA